MKKVDAHKPDGSRTPGGFSYLWPVRAGYELHADVVKPRGKIVRMYAPAVHPELPEELARLTRGDTDSTLQFIQEYGTLGYTQLVASESPQRGAPGYGGDPLIWVWVHAETVRLCLHLTGLLNREDMTALRTYLRSLTDPYLDTIGLDKDYWPAATVANRTQVQTAIWGNSGTVRVQSEGTALALNIHIDVEEQVRVLESDAALVDVARTIRRQLINQNIAQVYRHLLPQGDHEQSYFGFIALIEMVYWHLADAVTSDRIGACEDCGAPFIYRKATQRFCTPRGRQKESACAIRARVQKHRRKELASP